ncbi:hypothetical protein BJL95_23435 [Methylomonas sp. LWB]|nr:hypothetical protein BJL95_23435 [Methylomonas sp. LWB]
MTKKEIVDVNAKFHQKILLESEFYRQLMQAGCVFNQCILISIFPDGSNTYCGKVIRQDGRVIDFDIDFDAADYSIWTDTTDAFHEIYEKNKSSKPWMKEVIAYDLFHELERVSTSKR